MSTKKEKATTLAKRIEARMKKNAREGKTAKKIKERNAAKKEELEILIKEKKKNAGAKKTLLERIEERAGTYECPEGFEELKEGKRNEKTRFNKALKRGNEKALALKGFMKKTKDDKWCRPKKETFQKFLNEALRETKKKRISKRDLKAFNKRLNVLTSDQKKEERKRKERAAEQYRAEIRNQNVKKLEEKAAKAEAKGVWTYLSDAVSRYLGLKAAEACEERGYCPQQRAFVDRVTTDPGPARAETKNSTSEDAPKGQIQQRSSPVKENMKAGIEARLRKKEKVKANIEKRKEAASQRASRASDTGGIQGEIKMLQKCIENPEMVDSLNGMYQYSMNSKYSNECKRLHEMDLIKHEPATSGAIYGENEGYYWYWNTDKKKILEQIEERINSGGELTLDWETEIAWFRKIFTKAAKLNTPTFGKPWYKIDPEKVVQHTKDGGAGKIVGANIIKKCTTLETITDKFHWKADEKYFWYYQEDAKEVKNAMNRLGKERVFGRERRAKHVFPFTKF